MKKRLFSGFTVLAIAVLVMFVILSGCDTDPDENPISIGIEMVQVPPEGTAAPFTFLMGSPEEEADRNKLRETPQREVTLTGCRIS